MSSPLARGAARRSEIGEPHSAAGALSELDQSTRPELTSLWRQLDGRNPPRCFSRDLLCRAIAYRLQERAHGGLPVAVKRRLQAVVEGTAQGGVMAPVSVMRPGTQLIREWNGRTHAVTVVDDGFEYDGDRYRSLTLIAKRITGAHWSGPRFFGLRRRMSPPNRDA